MRLFQGGNITYILIVAHLRRDVCKSWQCCKCTHTCNIGVLESYCCFIHYILHLVSWFTLNSANVLGFAIVKACNKLLDWIAVLIKRSGGSHLAEITSKFTVINKQKYAFRWREKDFCLVDLKNYAAKAIEILNISDVVIAKDFFQTAPSGYVLQKKCYLVKNFSRRQVLYTDDRTQRDWWGMICFKSISVRQGL